jgi:hypothetical protein
MARDNGGEAGTVILAFVLGADTGAAVALLMAPTSEGAGKARDVAGQGRELWNRQRQTFANAVERGRDAYQQARGAHAPGAPAQEPL